MSYGVSEYINKPQFTSEDCSSGVMYTRRVSPQVNVSNAVATYCSVACIRVEHYPQDINAESFDLSLALSLDSHENVE